MIRSRVTATIVLAVAALGLTAGMAQAQDYPGTTAVPACNATVSFNVPALPNATVTLTVTCNSLINGASLKGTLTSSPIALSASTVAGHAVSYAGVKLPADWETNASHTVTLADATSGVLAVNAKFYVNSAGKIVAAPTTATTLARTGASSRTGDYVKSGIVLLALGAGAVRISRKRRTTVAAA